MLDRRSALAGVRPVSGATVALGEVRGFTLVQAAGFSPEDVLAIAAIAGALPRRPDLAAESHGQIIFRTGPMQFWFVRPADDDLAARLAQVCVVTPLSHSRTRIYIEGPVARDVLAKGIALDLYPEVFMPGMFAMTGLHHTPILLHCVAENRFEIYAMRTFAMNVWEWLEDAALEFV